MDRIRFRTRHIQHGGVCENCRPRILFEENGKTLFKSAPPGEISDASGDPGRQDSATGKSVAKAREWVGGLHTRTRESHLGVSYVRLVLPEYDVVELTVKRVG